MNAQFLVVARDQNTFRVLSRVLTDMNIPFERCTETAEISNKLTKHSFGGIIVDCDNEDPATCPALKETQSLPCKDLLSVALLEPQTNVQRAFSVGAQFVLFKPLSQERVKNGLRAVRSMMRGERRRSKRAPMQAFVAIKNLGDQSVKQAVAIDLSESGMAIQCNETLRAKRLLDCSFKLPHCPTAIQATGEIVWQDEFGRCGIRFVDLSEASRKLLKDWRASQNPVH